MCVKRQWLGKSMITISNGKVTQSASKMSTVRYETPPVGFVYSSPVNVHKNTVKTFHNSATETNVVLFAP